MCGLRGSFASRDPSKIQYRVLSSLGHETTAGSLTWATHALAKYPEIQGRLRDEIRSLIKHNPNPGYTEIEGLKFLNNFCREVLRLFCTRTEGILLPIPICLAD